jgi:hypothetical protein
MDKQRAYQESDILLDNPEYLVVKPNSAYAANYFTSLERYDERTFSSFLRNNTNYIFIDKNDNNFWVVSVSDDISEPILYKEGKAGAYLSNGDEDEFYEKFESISSILNQYIGYSETYEMLLQIKNGELKGKVEIDDLNIEPINVIPSNPSKSMVILSFDIDKYIGLFELGDYDQSFIDNIFSRYTNWAFRDWSTYADDFNEGYLIGNFNEENLIKLSEISRFILPEITLEKLRVGGNDDMKQLSERLNQLFSNQVENIISEFETVNEQCIFNTAKTEIEEDLCNVLEKYFIYKKTQSCFYKYVTSVNNLISLYKKVKRKSMSLSELLRNLLKKDNVSFNYEELQGYGECHHKFFDDSSFQQETSKQLEKILENIEDSNEFKSLDEFNKISDEINKKFKFGSIYNLPKDDTKSIMFRNIDPVDNLIIYTLRDKKSGSAKTGKSDWDQMKLLLYHPEFDFDS